MMVSEKSGKCFPIFVNFIIRFMNFRTWFMKKLDSTVNNYEFSVLVSEFHNKVYEKM